MKLTLTMDEFVPEKNSVVTRSRRIDMQLLRASRVNPLNGIVWELENSVLDGVKRVKEGK